MTSTVRLGRIAGVAVGVHWSVLAIVVLVVAGLSAHLPRIVPGYPWGAYLLAAVVAVALFVARCWPTRWPTRLWHNATGSRWTASRCGYSGGSPGCAVKPPRPVLISVFL